MRWVLAGFLALHGLIHFMGPAKAFGWADLPQLVQPISRGMGVVWGVAGLGLLLAAALLLAGSRAWWAVGLAAAALSQVAIVQSWGDAKAGTVANLILLAAVAYTVLGREGAGL